MSVFDINVELLPYPDDPIASRLALRQKLGEISTRQGAKGVEEEWLLCVQSIIACNAQIRNRCLDCSSLEYPPLAEDLD